MASTKRSSSASMPGTEVREPFAAISNLLQVPVALFEIQALAALGDNDKIIPLIKSVIKVTLADPNAWQRIATLTPQEVYGGNPGISDSN